LEVSGKFLKEMNDLKFWLDRLARKSRIPYPAFFSLVAVLLYLLGLPFMFLSDNLSLFLSEPRWIVVAAFGAVNGILIIFVFRGFSASLSGVRHIIPSNHDFAAVEDRLLGHLTSKAYWLVIFFWLTLNFIEAPLSMRWWRSYNQADIVTLYELIETLPCCIFGGVFMYMIPVGLPLAYRDLCLRSSFKEDRLLSEWMRPFKGFKRLIALTMLGAAIYAVFPPIIWGFATRPTTASSWSQFIPYAGIAAVLVSAVLLPHYFFHELFSKVKQTRIDGLDRQITETSKETEKGLLRGILLMLEKEQTRSLKTWLLDVRILGEVLAVALIHVILVESVTLLVHG
jgi:hypothetical protein